MDPAVIDTLLGRIATSCPDLDLSKGWSGFSEWLLKHDPQRKNNNNTNTEDTGSVLEIIHRLFLHLPHAACREAIPETIEVTMMSDSTVRRAQVEQVAVPNQWSPWFAPKLLLLLKLDGRTSLGSLELSFDPLKRSIFVSRLSNDTFGRDRIRRFSGIGRGLLEIVKAICLRLDFERVSLVAMTPCNHPLPVDHDLRRFYTRCGFSIVPERIGQYPRFAWIPDNKKMKK